MNSTKLISEICSQFPDFDSSELALEDRDLPYVFLGNFALFVREKSPDISTFSKINRLFNEAVKDSEEDIRDFLVAGFLEVLSDDRDTFQIFRQNADGNTRMLIEEYFS